MKRKDVYILRVKSISIHERINLRAYELIGGWREFTLFQSLYLDFTTKSEYLKFDLKERRAIVSVLGCVSL